MKSIVRCFYFKDSQNFVTQATLLIKFEKLYGSIFRINHAVKFRNKNLAKGTPFYDSLKEFEWKKLAKNFVKSVFLRRTLTTSYSLINRLPRNPEDPIFRSNLSTCQVSDEYFLVEKYSSFCGTPFLYSADLFQKLCGCIPPYCRPFCWVHNNLGKINPYSGSSSDNVGRVCKNFSDERTLVKNLFPSYSLISWSIRTSEGAYFP